MNKLNLKILPSKQTTITIKNHNSEARQNEPQRLFAKKGHITTHKRQYTNYRKSQTQLPEKPLNRRLTIELKNVHCQLQASFKRPSSNTIRNKQNTSENIDQQQNFSTHLGNIQNQTQAYAQSTDSENQETTNLSSGEDIEQPNDCNKSTSNENSGDNLLISTKLKEEINKTTETEHHNNQSLLNNFDNDTESLSDNETTNNKPEMPLKMEELRRRLTLAPSNLGSRPSTATQSSEFKQPTSLESITFPEIEHQDDKNTNSPNANDYQTVLFQDALEKESNGNILIMTAVSYKENNKADKDTQTDNKLVANNIKDENKQLNQQINKLSDNDIEDLISTESIESSEDEHENQSRFSSYNFFTNRTITTFAPIMPTQIENTIQSEQNSKMSQLTSLTSQTSTTSSIQKKEEIKETNAQISVRNEEDDKPEKTTLQNPVKKTQELEPAQEHGKLYTAACNMAKFVKEHPIAVVAGTCTLAASIYFGTAGIQQVGTFASSQWQKLLAMISTILPK